ncbi:MAG: hypothetical protein FJ098_08665, partial [Deltaproteobacteria bacterium]|nr:hypothetical protein [Deltaproteobacteria bacterium]
MPVSHDHPVHLYKAWHFWEEMLLQGRLRGWSSYWFFGYPAEELYPIGPDLWVAAFRALTLGALTWEATYSLAFTGVFAFAGWAVYSFGRRTLGATAGFVAALLWLLDPGAYREGGWSYTVDWAVWVQILAMAFALLALGKLRDVLERGRARDWVAAGLLFAAALLSHPMNVLVLGVALPLWILARITAGARPAGQELAATGGTLGLGVLLAGFWLLPMLARKAWTSDIGDLWTPMDPVARGLLDGTVFAGVWPAAVLAGLAGGFIGLGRRRWAPTFLLAFSAAFLFAATSTAFHELDLAAISAAFGKIQYQRLLIPAKAGLFLLAGYGVSAAVDAVRTRAAPPPLPGRGRRWRSLGLAALAAAALAPFVRPAAEQLLERHLEGVGGLTLDTGAPGQEDFRDFLAWSAAEWERDGRFWRIAYDLGYHDHTTMAAPVHNRTPYYKVGYTPAKLFRHAPEEASPALYRALSVRFVVTRQPLRGPDFEEVARFGALRVLRFTGYREERWALDGPGEVEALEFGEERIRLRLEGVEPGTRLCLHVAAYPRWRARLDGHEVPLEAVPAVPGGEPMLMELPVENGLLELDYVARGPDVLGWLATLAGLGLCALILAAAGSPALAARLRPRTEPLGLKIRRGAPWAAGAAVAVAVAVVALRLHAAGYGGMGGDRLSRLLPEASISLASRPCDDRRGDRWYCSDREWNYVGRTAQRFDGAFQPCVWAHPADDGPLEIRFPSVRLGAALTGHHGIADSGRSRGRGGAPVTVTVLADGEVLGALEAREGRGWAPVSLDTSAQEGEDVELILRITAPRAGRRHFCFDYRL